MGNRFVCGVKDGKQFEVKNLKALYKHEKYNEITYLCDRKKLSNIHFPKMLEEYVCTAGTGE
jgi:hypothetical protein